ncbi:MAG: hydrolase [Victivallales bacterium]|nr:hydrolase [Victivallales bacterium]
MNNLRPDSSCLILIDMQEKLQKAMSNVSSCIENQELLLKTAAILKIDNIVTEQYPAGLGHTIDELKNLLTENTEIIEKTTFSCFGESNFRTTLRAKTRKTLIVCGIEAHVCVQQTVFDLLAEDYEVVIPADALTSRNDDNYRLALESMRQAGAFITSTEAVIFMLLGDAKHPDFRTISKLIK